MKEMNTLTVNGEAYKLVDADAARKEDIGAIGQALDAVLEIQRALIGGEEA